MIRSHAVLDPFCARRVFALARRISVGVLTAAATAAAWGVLQAVGA